MKNQTMNTNIDLNTITTSTEPLYVTRDYLTGTLCREGRSTLSDVIGIYAKTGNDYVQVSKGILFYSLYAEGELVIVDQIGENQTFTREVIEALPLNFLPEAFTSVWTNTIRQNVTAGANLGRNDVLNLWRSFMIEAMYGKENLINATGVPFTTEMHKGALNASRDILCYTLYHEGVHQVFDFVGTGNGTTQENVLNTPMEFLPTELKTEWRKTVLGRIPTGAATTRDEVMNIWKNFCLHTVYEGNDAIVNTYANIGKDASSFARMVGICGPIVPTRNAVM